MSVELKMTGEVLTAYLSGEIDHHNAREMRETVDEAIELNRPSLLVLDFGQVGFMDSSGIGFIMGRYRNLARFGASMHIASTPAPLCKMMKLAGIEKLATLPDSTKGVGKK